MEFEQIYIFKGEEYSLFYSLSDPSEIFSLGYSIGVWLLFLSFSAFLLVENRKTIKEIGIIATWVQIWCKLTIDAALLVGIAISSLAVLNLTQAIGTGSWSPNTDESYRAMAEVLSPLVMAGFMTGAASVLHDAKVRLNLRISPLLYLTIFFIALVISFNTELFGLWAFPMKILYNPFSTAMLFALFFIYLTLGCIFSNKSIIKTASDAMLAAGLCSSGIFLLLWFYEGGNLNQSLDAIVIVASVLALCSIWMVLIFLLGMVFDRAEDLDLPKKNWHLLETLAFFFFLVFAPLGVSEHFREVSEQFAQEAHNQAQQKEIDQLKAQIKMLSE